MEAALLATVLPNPKNLRANDPGPYAIQRSLEILELMNWHRDKTIGRRLSQIVSSED
jgi:membrane peptidoglycan carboxypeptidase